MRVLILGLIGAVLFVGCADIKLATCTNSDGLDLAAMRNTPYVAFYDSEESLQAKEREIERIRQWASKQEPCVRAAYQKWLNSSEWMVGVVRKDNEQRRRAEREAKDVPKP